MTTARCVRACQRNITTANVRFPPIADAPSLGNNPAMRWADLPNALVSSLWAALLFFGLDGITSIQQQHAPGYPATGQWVLYVGFPATFLSLGLFFALLSRRARWFYDL